MEARYPGRCGICDEAIDEGDSIVQFEGEWCHSACADEQDDDE